MRGDVMTATAVDFVSGKERKKRNKKKKASAPYSFDHLGRRKRKCIQMLVVTHRLYCLRDCIFSKLELF